VNIPSYSAQTGRCDRGARQIERPGNVTTHAGAKTSNVRQFGWLEWNPDKMQGTFLAIPAARPDTGEDQRTVHRRIVLEIKDNRKRLALGYGANHFRVYAFFNPILLRPRINQILFSHPF
jgi:hypothetical protein